MNDPLLDAMVAVAPAAPASQFRFGAVTASTASVSIVVNFGGTSLTIPRVRIFSSAWPVVTDWVVIGFVGADAFVLGKRF